VCRYLAREYLSVLCDATTFGLRNQCIVFSTLVITAGISVNAVTSYFSDVSIDWSNPAPLTSLLNMQLIGSLLFLALIAMERMNNETIKLLKHLDVVAIEVTRMSSVQQSTLERELVALEQAQGDAGSDQPGPGKGPGSFTPLRDLQLRKQLLALERERKKMGFGLATILNDVEAMMEGSKSADQLSKSIKTLCVRLLSRMDVSADYQYLQNIISELRDQTNNKKILGILVDRQMLSRIFGGVLGIMYIIIKEFADQIIGNAKRLTPMGSLLSSVAGIGPDDQTSGGAGGDGQPSCLGLDVMQVAVLELMNFSATCVQTHCTASCNASNDVAISG
jgi:hypothetical protein